MVNPYMYIFNIKKTIIRIQFYSKLLLILINRKTFSEYNKIQYCKNFKLLYIKLNFHYYFSLIKKS